MAFGFDLDSIINKLGESPIVQNAMNQFTEVRNGIVAAMNHFNTRFDKLETQGAETLRLVRAMNPGEAGDDGLMKLLAESGEEMVMQTPEPMPVVNEVAQLKPPEVTH